MNDIPKEFDVRQSRIFFIYDPLQLQEQLNSPGRNKYIKIITPQSQPCPSLKYESIEEYLDVEGAQAWDLQFGVNSRLGELNGAEADLINPKYFEYDGPTKLSQQEQSAVYEWLDGWRSDFSMGMLYDMVEGFGFKPGSCNTLADFPPVEKLAKYYERYVGEDPRGTLDYVLSLMSYGSDISSEDISILIQKVRESYKQAKRSN